LLLLKYRYFWVASIYSVFYNFVMTRRLCCSTRLQTIVSGALSPRVLFQVSDIPNLYDTKRHMGGSNAFQQGFIEKKKLSLEYAQTLPSQRIVNLFTISAVNSALGQSVVNTILSGYCEVADRCLIQRGGNHGDGIV